MNIDYVYNAYVLVMQPMLAVLNLMLAGLFIWRFLQPPQPIGFMILSLANVSFAFTAGYHGIARIQKQFDIELFPLAVWKVFAWIFIVLDPIGILCWVTGSVVLVSQYQKNATIHEPKPKT